MKTYIKFAFLVGSLAAAWTGNARATDGRAQLKKASAEAKIGLLQAIDAAQNAVTGGQIIEASLEWVKNPAYYGPGAIHRGPGKQPERNLAKRMQRCHYGIAARGAQLARTGPMAAQSQSSAPVKFERVGLVGKNWGVKLSSTAVGMNAELTIQ